MCVFNAVIFVAALTSLVFVIKAEKDPSLLRSWACAITLGVSSLFLSNLSCLVCLCLTEWLTIGLPVCLRPLASQSVCVSTYLPVCRSCVYDVCVCLSVSLQERRISQSFWQPNIDIVSLLICHFRFFSVLRWLRVSVNDRQYSGLLSRFLRRKLSWSQIRTEWVQWNFPAFALYYYFVHLSRTLCADIVCCCC